MLIGITNAEFAHPQKDDCCEYGIFAWPVCTVSQAVILVPFSQVVTSICLSIGIINANLFTFKGMGAVKTVYLHARTYGFQNGHVITAFPGRPSILFSRGYVNTV